MVQLGGSCDVLDEPKHKMHANAYLDEDDQLPLKLRLKTLLSSKRLSAATDANLGIPGNKGGSTSHVGIDVKTEENHGYWQDVFSLPLSCFTSERSNSELSREHEMFVDSVAADLSLKSSFSNQYVGKPNSFVTERAQGEVNAHTVGADKVIVNSSNFPQHSKLPNICAEVKVEDGDDNPKSSSEDGIVSSSGSDILAVKNKNEILHGFADEPNCISLRERQRMLFSRKPLGIMKPVLKGNPERLINQPMECHGGAKSGKSHFVNGSFPVAGHPFPSIHDGSACNPSTILWSGPLDDTLSGSSSATHQRPPLVDFIQGAESAKLRNCQGVKESSPSFEKISTKVNPCDVQGFMPALSISTPDSAVSISGKVKDEPSDCKDLCGPDNVESTRPRSCIGFHESGQRWSSDNNANVINVSDSNDSVPTIPYNTFSSALSASVQVKDELLDNNYSDSLNKNAVGCSLTDFLSLKSEVRTSDESLEDLVDHMPLLDRIKLMMSENLSNMNSFKNFGRLKENVLPECESGPPVSEPVKPISSKRLRKRKRTATNSVEIALEEDAPGLLRALADKGISMDEIKLFGDIENDDILEGSFIEENFSELQAIMSKIFSPRQSVLKFAPIRCAKGAKTSYCLPCLVSLIEQSRYLQFRKWPVEWGWCRDIRSFLFVFERHNRIVLERPEYGYATYFFEIADSVPINWQIKRLVTTMKLTNCSRLALIENKALLVGEDLSEGEANVMMEYGWTPNSGLASMLNYCDRVFHDRKKEDGTEWKSKIRKLLMDGYNGGTLVSTVIPKKVIEYNAEQSAQIKTEL